MARPIITLTTDYGTSDHYVGVMKGVILNINPEVNMVDISHSVLAHDILDGALTIGQADKYFPPRTIHLVVVDPGVGTARRPILVAGDTHYFVAPDNGVLSAVYDQSEVASRVAHHRGTLFPESGEHHISRARHFRADRGVAQQDLADIQLWRRDHGFRPLCDSETEGQRECDQVRGAARGSLWQFGYESAARGRSGAGRGGREVHDSTSATA